MKERFDLDWWTEPERRVREYGRKGNVLGFRLFLSNAIYVAERPEEIEYALTAWYESGRARMERKYDRATERSVG